MIIYYLKHIIVLIIMIIEYNFEKTIQKKITKKIIDLNESFNKNLRQKSE